MSYLAEDFNFRVVSIQRGDRRQPAARFSCEGCPETFDVPLNSGKVINPEHITKRARRGGWDVPLRRGGKILCPACEAKRATAAKGESGAKVVPMPQPFMSPHVSDPQQQELLMATPQAPQAAAPKIPMQTDLTIEQKLKCRSILDRSFDDQAGCYLDGYSDQRIGEEINVPWSLVAKLREAAYGPIRVDPEITAMRNTIHDFERKLKEHAETWKRVEASAWAELNDLKSRLQTIEKRKGIAA